MSEARVGPHNNLPRFVVLSIADVLKLGTLGVERAYICNRLPFSHTQKAIISRKDYTSIKIN